MVPMKSGGIPINPYRTALNAGAKPSSFGTNPFGMSGGYDPGMRWNAPTFSGMKGCGCGPVNGCGCDGASGLNGMGQSVSLDQIIQNTASWLGSFASSQLPASAAVAPQYGSAGNIITQLMNYAPYLLIGYLAYKALK